MQDEVIIDIENPKDNDLVSREAVLKAVSEGCFELRGVYGRCEELINALPSVNPQPSEHFIDGVHAMGYREGYKDAQKQKSGKWILTIEDWNKWTCSNCGYVKRTDIHVNIGWKYCPNCGAKMEVEE